MNIESLKKRIKKINIPDFYEKFKLLSPREKRYFRIMKSQSGVLYITAKPGVGKSAIAKSIATKLGMRYMDIRLSMVDETDVGLFPDVSQVEMSPGQFMKVLDHIVPKWSQIANNQPTLIHFEELNRAPQAVRNAALQLLLERAIGTEFEFNDNVFMMASGNLGDEDGTDVEEFDRALNNRLIHVAHDLPPKEWIEWFANDNIHPDIVEYINNHPHKLYVKPTENATAHATPRSWTFLSDFILNNFGGLAEDSNGQEYIEWGKAQDYLSEIENDGMSFIGNEIVPFLSFVNDRIQINIHDIINNLPKIANDVKSWRENNRRDRYSEMIRDLKGLNPHDFSHKQITNCISFLELCAPEERSSYLLEMVDDASVDLENPGIERMLLTFRDELTKLRSLNHGERTK